MKIGFFQYDVIWRNPKANLLYIKDKIKDSVFDLLVLPELFTTGYAFEAKEDLMLYGENLKNSKTVLFLTELMEIHQGYIVGTIPEIEGNNLYNTSIVVGKEGLVASYRKIHLTDYEKRGFDAGNTVSSFQLKGVKIGLQICFDVWFASLSSILKAEEVAIFCVSSSYGGSVTPTITPIRALENQCYVINCNRIGTENFDSKPETFFGNSQLIDPDGTIIIQADQEEALIIKTITLSKVNYPDFGRQITSDFMKEHRKYCVQLHKNQKIKTESDK